MTDKQTNHDPIAHAARLLREAAEELRQAHAFPGSEGWENETDAKAAYDEHMAAAQALEDWEAAVGAGGVQALSAAPAIGDELRDTLVAVSAAIAERDDRAAQKMIREILAASPTPPAEQQAPATGGYVQPVPDKCDRITWRGRYYHLPLTAQAALKAAPGDALDEALRERDDAEDFIDATLDEVLGHERPEWSSSYGRADALNDVQERMTALHKPAVDKAWGRFQSAMAAPQQEAPKAAPGEPDPADIIAGALQISRGHAIEMMREALEAAPQRRRRWLSEQIDQLERKLAIIGVVGVIDGHDVVRRESVLEIARRAALAAQGGE